MTTPAERTAAAERRAAAEGHRAFAQRDGSIKVVSDTQPGKHYVVTFHASGVGEAVTFTCRPVGTAAYDDDHRDLTSRPAATYCKHAAVAARRLAREGLIRRSGPLFVDGWVATAKAAELTAARPLPASELVDVAEAAAGRALLAGF